MTKITELLKPIIEKKGISNRALARAIGVDHASLYRSLKGDGNPEAKTIEKILDYLGYDLKLVKRKEVIAIRRKQAGKRRGKVKVPQFDFNVEAINEIKKRKQGMYHRFLKPSKKGG